MCRLSRKFRLELIWNLLFVPLEEGFISAYLKRMRLDGSVVFFTVLMYLCTVAEFFSPCYGY